MRMVCTTLISLILLFSCTSQNWNENKIESIVNSKWECQIAENCINVYDFKSNNTFSFVSCEMQDEYFGKYYFIKDTLIIEQEGSIYDNEFPKESRHRAEKKQYKVIIKDQKLIHLSLNNWVNDKWVKSSFKFDPKYVYTKK